MIDPSLPLSVRGPQLQNPLEIAHGVASISDLMQRRKLQDQQLENEKLVARQHQLSIDQHQRALDDQKALDDAAREDYERWSKEQTGTISSPIKAEPISRPAATGMDDLVQRGQPSGAQNDLVQRGQPDVTAQPLTGQQATPELTAASLMTKRGQPQQPATQVAQQAPPPAYTPDYMRQAQALIGKGKGHLASGLVKTQLENWKKMADFEEQKIKTGLAKTEQVAQILNGVKDQAGWTLAIDTINGMGMDASKMDPIFSAKIRDQYVANGTKVAEQYKKLKDDRDALHQGLEDYGRSVTAVAALVMMAENKEQAASIVANAKEIPGISHKAADSVLATYNMYGRDGARKMALTPEQTTQADFREKEIKQQKNYQDARLKIAQMTAGRDRVSIVQGVDDNGSPAWFRVNKDDGSSEVIPGMKPNLRASQVKDYTTRLATIDERKSAALDREEKFFDGERRKIYLADADDKLKEQQSAELEKKREAKKKEVVGAFETERRTLEGKLTPPPTIPAKPVATPPAQPVAQPAAQVEQPKPVVKKTATKAEIDAFARQAGKNKDEVEKELKAKGYTITP